VHTKFGPTFLLNIEETQNNFLKVFMPKRYSSVFDDDIDSINSKNVSLNLFIEECVRRQSHIFWLLNKHV
jgi:hypothetical protein